MRWLAQGENGLAFELAVAERLQRLQGVLPARLEADLRAQASSGDLVGQQAQIRAEGGRFARLVDIKGVQPGMGMAGEIAEADRSVLAGCIAEDGDHAVPSN